MMNWTTLEDVCIKITDGSHFSPQECEHGYLMASSKDMLENGWDFSNIKQISKGDYEKLVKSDCKPLKNDVLIIKDGNNYLEKVFTCRKEIEIVILSSIAILRPDIKKVVPLFLQYLLRTPFIKDAAANLVSGAAIPRVILSDFKKVKIPNYSLEKQRQLALILGAYDELMEINNRRIKLLEETARELYKEWFVRMRFPGYKKAKFVKGLPEGWKVNKLSDLVSTQYGYTASATNDIAGPKFLRITDIADTVINWNDVPHCVIPEKELSKYLLQYGDIVVARTGATVGFAKRINKFHRPTVFASYLVRLKPRNIFLNYYLGIIIESVEYREYIQSVAGGAAQPQANASLMTRFALLTPSDLLIERFNSIIEPFFDQKEILLQQNIQLGQIRDRLLPRLIGGKLLVKANHNTKQSVEI